MFTDIIPPTGTVVIEGGLISTDSVLVDLEITGWDVNGLGTTSSPIAGGVASYQLSNDGINWTPDISVTQPFANGTTIDHSGWDLSDVNYGGTSDSGTKTVYVKLKDNGGNESSSVWTQTLQEDFNAGTTSQVDVLSSDEVSLVDAGVTSVASWLTNASQALPNMINDAAGVSVVEYNNKIYVIGGIDSGWNAYNSVQVFDVGSGTWSTVASINVGGTDYFRMNAGAVEINGKIYLVGGRSGSSNNDTVDTVLIYNIASDSWSLGASSGYKRHSATIVEDNGAVYVIGGVNENGDIQDTVHTYNAVTNSWVTSGYSATPGGMLSHSTAQVIDGEIYVIGGKRVMGGGNPSLNEVNIYNIAGDSWSTGTVMPSNRNGMCSVLTAGKIYVAGGYDTVASDLSNKVERYDPVLDSWTTEILMNSERHRCGAAIVNGYLYVFGGIDAAWAMLDTFEMALVSDYNAAGTLESSIFNAQEATSFTQLAWTETLPANTDVAIDYRGCNVSDCSDGTWVTGLTTSPAVISVTDKQYFQYRSNLSSTDSAVTSTLSEVRATYDGTISDTIILAASGSSPEIIQQQAGAPAAPTVIDGQALSSTSIQWNFDDNSNDETGFRLMDAENDVLVDINETNITSIEEIDLHPNEEYTGRRVRAYNSNGESDRSEEFPSVVTLAPDLSPQVTLQTPSSVTVGVDGDFPNLDQGDSALKFDLVYTEAAVRSAQLVTSDWIKDTEYTFTDLEPGQSFQLRVTTRNQSSVESSPSPLSDPIDPVQEGQPVMNLGFDVRLSDGSELSTDPIHPSSVLQGSMYISNTGAGIATNVLANVVVPEFITYDPQSLSISAVGATSYFHPGAVFSADNNGVAASWPLIGPGESYTVNFQLGFNKDALRQYLAATHPEVTLQATLSYDQSGTTTYSSPITVTPDTDLLDEPVEEEPEDEEPVEPITEEELEMIEDIIPILISEPGPAAPSPSDSSEFEPETETTSSYDAESFTVEVSREEDELVVTGMASEEDGRIEFTGTTSEPNSVVTLIFNNDVTIIVISDASGFWSTYVSAERLGLARWLLKEI